jgi:hypothetical protein
MSSLSDGRVFPSASGDRSDRGAASYDREDRSGSKRDSHSDEGVEVVLGNQGDDTVVDSRTRPTQDQNVFRAPHPVRPRAVRAPHGPPHVKNSGSYGYGGPPPPHGEYGHRPYPVPYAQSGSFDEGSYHHPPPHYSPHVQYPPPGSRHPQEDVNVISPNHKGEQHRPPRMSRGRYGAPSSHYQYPPASPVSRPSGPAATSSPPRLRNYAMRRPDGQFSSSQRGRGPEDAPWSRGHATPDRSRPPLVTESSFDSEHYSSRPSHPNTPNVPHYSASVHPDPNYSFYGGAASFGSFDSHAPPPPPPHFDDHRYYGHSPHHPPESPYSPYSHHAYSPGGYYDAYSPHPDYHHQRSYDDDSKHYGDMHHAVTPNESRSKNDTSGMVLPKAAAEIDFDVNDPPTEPVTPPSKIPLCESPGEVNSYDVLCGRGGGTNSQVGNRRFRKLVQDFQPIYLLARRKDKPLLARTIVLIIRKRGGRFLKKDEETGELYEVGDAKAEAKTSQALREGLDVRATKSAASSLMDKKKKKKGKNDIKDDESEEPAEEELEPPSPSKTAERPPPQQAPESPPSLPRLNVQKPRSPSPEQAHYRKRRRMRSGDAADETEADRKSGCGMGFQDKLFSDFCPPRADIARPPSPAHDMNTMELSNTPPRRGMKYDVDDIRYEEQAGNGSIGCAGIALDIVTGAATTSFCLGPRRWR